MITIEDILVNPLSQPLAYATVYFNSVTTSGVPLLQAKGEAMTTELGELNITLVRGTYRVYLEQTEYNIKYPIGYILESVFDTAQSPVTLGELIVEELPNEDNQ